MFFDKKKLELKHVFFMFFLLKIIFKNIKQAALVTVFLKQLSSWPDNPSKPRPIIHLFPSIIDVSEKIVEFNIRIILLFLNIHEYFFFKIIIKLFFLFSK